MNIGSTIRSIRKGLRLTQIELANRSNIKQSYLSHVESGIKQPTLTVLEDISKALGVNLPFLIFYSIEDSDIREDKKEMYRILHPHMLKMIDEIVFPL